MICKLTQNIKITQDEGDLFEDEFDNYPSEIHAPTMKLQIGNVDHPENLIFDPFEASFIKKTSFTFDSDQESFKDPEEVRSPKQLPLAFEINYIRPLPQFQLGCNHDSDHEDHESDGANDDSVSEIRKIFNNAPSRIVLIIREEADQIQFK